MKITKYEYPVPLSIAFLSDHHNADYRTVISKTAKLQPDIIAITGDVINGHKTVSDEPIVSQQVNVLPFLKGCADIAPTFFSFGNHEWMLTPTDEELIRKTGVCVLDNSFVTYRGVAIGGLTSAVKTEYKKLGITDRYPTDEERGRLLQDKNSYIPQTQWLDSFERQQGYKLLLSHHPEYYDAYLAHRKVDLVLSGHCHGGQIRLFGRGLFAPGQGVLPKQTKGIHGRMIISTGLSNTAKIIPRLFNPTEIVYTDF